MRENFFFLKKCGEFPRLRRPRFMHGKKEEEGKESKATPAATVSPIYFFQEITRGEKRLAGAFLSLLLPQGQFAFFSLATHLSEICLKSLHTRKKARAYTCST